MSTDHKNLYLHEMTKVTMMTRDSTAASHQDSPHLVMVSSTRSPMALKHDMPRRQPTVMLPGEVRLWFENRLLSTSQG